MATSFQSRLDRENVGNSLSKSNVSKTAPGQRNLSTKTPRKALGDVGNIQHGTGKKFQTPKPSKVKIFNETPKTKTSVKSKKPSFSVLNTHREHSKISSDVKTKTKNENMLPDIEKIIPFVDQENDLPRPEHITKLLNHTRLLNPLLLAPTGPCEDHPIAPSYKLEDFEPPLFDETFANIFGYNETPQLVEVDPLSVLDLLPPLDDIDLSSYE